MEKYIPREKRRKSLKESAHSLELAYARNMAEYELEVGDGDRFIDCAKEKEIQVYGMSTVLRGRFLKMAIVAAFNDDYVTVTKVRQRLGASRAALDVMINECEDAGWIRVKRNKQNYRSIQAAEILVENWIAYVDHNKEMTNKYKLREIRTTLLNIKELLETKLALQGRQSA